MQMGKGIGATLLTSVAMLLPAAYAQAASDPSEAATQDWAIHAQTTFVEQFHPGFRSSFRGANSLDPAPRGNETFDITLYAGLRPWDGAEIWINPEIDQGFGLSDTLGIDGFPSGEAYKVGRAAPYPRLPRFFLRQTIDLGGDEQKIEPDLNQLGGQQTSNRIVITLGKFSVVDIFDHNSYADDPRNYFLNWALIDAATFDYAANAWGYTYGGAIEWDQNWWAVRAGLFDLSNVPNSAKLEGTVLRQFQVVTEEEADYTLFQRSGKIRLISFLSHGNMGLLRDAIDLSQATGQAADTALVRHVHARAGIALSFEQQLTDELGAFGRFGYADASREPFEFTDAASSETAGLSLNGNRWDRPNDVIGLAVIQNNITREQVNYFNAGGLGILAGDGMLPHPGPERIVEVYYDLQATDGLWVTPDYQFVSNPAFNRDRGPVSILGIRLHAQT